jgi:hypothetical protein
MHLNPFCEFCGQEFDSVDSFNQHTFICKSIPIDCTLKPYGCREKVYIKLFISKIMIISYIIL